VNALTKPEAAAVAEQHDRSKFLGGSDIAAVMGLSPWATPVELWMQKTGRGPREEPDEARKRMFERGHKLEPFIRDMVIAKLTDMGCEVELLAVNQRYADAEHPFLACEIDFELRLTGEVDIGGTVYQLKDEEINADAKSVSGFARKKWGTESNEDVPIEYAAQFMHGLGIRGRRFCLVAALRSFDDVDIYWTVRDDETIAAMREKAVLFWTKCVLGDEAPDPFTFSDIKLLFPSDNGQAAEATEEIAQKVSDLRRIKAAIGDLEEQEKLLQFDIGEFISPHSRLTFDGKDICTWKAQSDTRLDQSKLAEAEIYRKDADTGEFTLIPNPVGAFSRTKSIRVLRLVKPKKGS
jgi:putative phage-type endonuclease